MLAEIDACRPLTASALGSVKFGDAHPVGPMSFAIPEDEGHTYRDGALDGNLLQPLIGRHPLESLNGPQLAPMEVLVDFIELEDPNRCC